jgi:hypothetical protein
MGSRSSNECVWNSYEVVPVLLLTEHHTMKGYWGGGIALRINFGIRWSGQLYAPAALAPKKRAPGTHWIGDWIGLRAGLDAVVKRKILSPAGRKETHDDLTVARKRFELGTRLERKLHGRCFLSMKLDQKELEHSDYAYLCIN